MFFFFSWVNSVRTTISPHRFKATEEKRAKIKGIWNNLNKTFFWRKKKKTHETFWQKTVTFRLKHLERALNSHPPCVQVVFICAWRRIAPQSAVSSFTGLEQGAVQRPSSPPNAFSTCEASPHHAYVSVCSAAHNIWRWKKYHTWWWDTTTCLRWF